MVIKIVWNFEKLFNNKITEFAGMYLRYLEEPEKVNASFSKENLFWLHVFGKASLAYFRVLVFIMGILYKVSGRKISREEFFEAWTSSLNGGH